MPDVAIKVENLGKRYRLGVKAHKQDTLVGTLAAWARSPLANYRRLRSLSHFESGDAGDDVLWALQDVSFEVKQGEVLGIIGRNGAGKSTLLKILSRITPPTTGQVDLNGRVASLLEVGTGFHPELTGRENVYLNGTILGMSKTEIDRKFDEIIEFSGVEKFIDTPVKRYSSGMNVRLAFAVAAHLEPEILLIDEVLAVGDIAFQKKCLGKMDEVSRSGRTVLFVSHNMASVKTLCQSGILLKNGSVVMQDDIVQVCTQYTKELLSTQTLDDREVSIDVQISDSYGEPISEWCNGQEISIRIQVNAQNVLRKPAIDLAFYTPNGQKLFSVESDRLEGGTSIPEAKQLSFTFYLKNTFINVSELLMDVGVRAEKNGPYIGLFHHVDAISVAPVPVSYARYDNIVCLPTSLVTQHIA